MSRYLLELTLLDENGVACVVASRVRNCPGTHLREEEYYLAMAAKEMYRDAMYAEGRWWHQPGCVDVSYKAGWRGG